MNEDRLAEIENFVLADDKLEIAIRLTALEAAFAELENTARRIHNTHPAHVACTEKCATKAALEKAARLLAELKP